MCSRIYMNKPVQIERHDFDDHQTVPRMQWDMGDNHVPIKAPGCAVRKYYHDCIYSGRWSTITIGPYVE